MLSTTIQCIQSYATISAYCYCVLKRERNPSAECLDYRPPRLTVLCFQQWVYEAKQRECRLILQKDQKYLCCRYCTTAYVHTRGFSFNLEIFSYMILLLL